MWLLFFLIGSFAFFFSSLYLKHNNEIVLSNKKKIVPIKNKTFLFLIIAFVCVCLSSFRFPKDGTDTITYKAIFESIANGRDLSTFNLEYGFLLFTKLISFITSNFTLYLFIVNTFIWSCLYIFLNRYSSDFRYSLWLFLFLGYFDLSMCLIRQYMALSILLLSYKYVINRSIYKFTIIVTTATLFHTTAFIFIPVYFIYNIRNNITILKYTFACLISIVCTDFIYSILGSIDIYKHYLSSNAFGIQEGVKIAPILNFLISYLIIIFCIKYNNKSKSLDNSLITLLIIGSIFYIFSFKFTQIGRISTYFSIFSIILLPNILRRISNKRKKKWFTISFFLLFLLRYCTIAFLRPEWYGIYPYKFNFL